MWTARVGQARGFRYVEGPVYVKGSDPYGLDSDGDGVGEDESLPMSRSSAGSAPP